MKPMSEEKIVTLGGVIGHFRQRRRRPHSTLPWSQEDLALAIGADQAHVSRIESNRLHPQYSTLAHICEVLELSIGERRWVMSLAGYQEIAPLPDEDEVRSVEARLVPLLELFSYPASLVDEGERIWYYNHIGAALFGAPLGMQDQELLLTRLRGKRYLELVFPPDAYERWRTHWEDPDSTLTQLMVLLWRAYRIRPQDRDMTRVLGTLKKYPEFLYRWEQVESGETDLLFLGRTTFAMLHPEFGRIHYNAWRTHYAEDERFMVSHFTPMDPATSRVFECVARHVRPVTSSERLSRSAMEHQSLK